MPRSERAKRRGQTVADWRQLSSASASESKHLTTWPTRNTYMCLNLTYRGNPTQTGAFSQHDNPTETSELQLAWRSSSALSKPSLSFSSIAIDWWLVLLPPRVVGNLRVARCCFESRSMFPSART